MSLSEHSDNRYQLLAQIGALVKQHPGLDLSDALSSGQVASKKWLIEVLEELDLSLGTIFVLGGWWGFLPAMMFESRLRFDKIRSFDLDPSCAPVAETVNRKYVMDGWRFKASTADMREMELSLCRHATKRSDGSLVELAEVPDTLINTSCEHVSPFSSWFQRVPVGKIVVLQSNDFRAHSEHVNCVSCVEELEASAPLSDVLFRGTLELPDYHRFLLVGRK